jgi:hypothetical protein
VDQLGAVNPHKVEQFKARFLEFCQKELEDSCLSAVLHLDETTPHIHAHLVPIHREKGWLSWEDWFGGKEKLRSWQDKFAQYFEPLGLRRGLSRSVAVHEKIQDFYARINEDLKLPDFEQELTLPPPLPEEATENYYQRLVGHFRQKLPPLHDALETIAAHAKNEAWEKAKPAMPVSCCTL